MAETIKEKWDDFREEFDRTQERYRHPSVQRVTRFERDYGPDGKYRRLEPDVDGSAGSEYL
ncbi:MAG: hypothetical protein GWO11_06465 [Desulfuromonadales bacterium]|nr:hypothetical protein [Desulfuromonadales bacterium]NIR34004.1 hypothetical protein [Desulfuromonadales bacterium]NIS42676.1 hypothetical protein [Desulfuromonadales bacterium]